MLYVIVLLNFKHLKFYFLIFQNVFEIAELELSLESLKNVLTHDFCGDYRIQFCFMHITDKISCHTLDICIIEVEADNC